MTRPDSDPSNHPDISRFVLPEGEPEPFEGYVDTVVAVNGLIPEDIRNATDPRVAELSHLYTAWAEGVETEVTPEQTEAFNKVDDLKKVMAEELEKQEFQAEGHTLIVFAFTHVAHAAIAARYWQDLGQQPPAA